MYPVLFEIFGFPLRSFGIMVALGFLIGLLWTRAEARRQGQDPEMYSDLFTHILLGGILGARLLYVIVHADKFPLPGGLLGIFKIWEGGLVYYGGFIGAFGLGILYLRRHQRPILPAIGCAMPGVWLGQSIGRIGCLLVGDDFGSPTDVPWAIAFPEREHSLIPPELIGVPIHPTQIYLSLNAFLLFLVTAILLRRGMSLHKVAGVGLSGYAVGRFIIEFYRGDDVARGIYAGLATSQWLSVPLFLIGIALVMRRASGATPSADSAAAG